MIAHPEEPATCPTCRLGRDETDLCSNSFHIVPATAADVVREFVAEREEQLSRAYDSSLTQAAKGYAPKPQEEPATAEGGERVTHERARARVSRDIFTSDLSAFLTCYIDQQEQSEREVALERDRNANLCDWANASLESALGRKRLENPTLSDVIHELFNAHAALRAELSEARKDAETGWTEVARLGVELSEARAKLAARDGELHEMRTALAWEKAWDMHAKTDAGNIARIILNNVDKDCLDWGSEARVLAERILRRETVAKPAQQEESAPDYWPRCQHNNCKEDARRGNYCWAHQPAPRAEALAQAEKEEPDARSTNKQIQTEASAAERRGDAVAGGLRQSAMPSGELGAAVSELSQQTDISTRASGVPVEPAERFRVGQRVRRRHFVRHQVGTIQAYEFTPTLFNVGWDNGHGFTKVKAADVEPAEPEAAPTQPQQDDRPVTVSELVRALRVTADGFHLAHRDSFRRILYGVANELEQGAGK